VFNEEQNPVMSWDSVDQTTGSRARGTSGGTLSISFPYFPGINRSAAEFGNCTGAAELRGQKSAL